MAKKSTNNRLQELATMLLSVTQLFFGFALAAESASDSGWPLQTFVTAPNINPPVFSVNKMGATADGYIFLDTNTNGALASDLVATIITDDGEVVWSAGYSDTTNPSLQTFNGEDVIIYVGNQPLLGCVLSLVSERDGLTIECGTHSGRANWQVKLAEVTARSWS